jgi:Gamma tubulin complex component C-terminal
MNQLEQHCQLSQHLSILRKVFFMEAGLHMELFTREIFDSLDKGLKVNNTILLNGHFQETIEGISGRGLSSVDFKRLQVFFRGDPKNFSAESIEALDFLGFNFASDWPLDIIFDNQSIEKYNTIFSFLLRIRRCNFLIQKRDFWVNLPVPKSTDGLNLRDQLIVKNKMALNSLIHKMQLFQ